MQNAAHALIACWCMTRARRRTKCVAPDNDRDVTEPLPRTVHGATLTCPAAMSCLPALMRSMSPLSLALACASVLACCTWVCREVIWVEMESCWVLTALTCRGGWGGVRREVSKEAVMGPEIDVVLDHLVIVSY